MEADGKIRIKQIEHECPICEGTGAVEIGPRGKLLLRVGPFPCAVCRGKGAYVKGRYVNQSEESKKKGITGFRLITEGQVVKEAVEARKKHRDGVWRERR